MPTFFRDIIYLGNIGTPSVFSAPNFIGNVYTGANASVTQIQVNENFSNDQQVVLDTNGTNVETITYFGGTHEVFDAGYFKATVTQANGTVETGVNVGVFYTDTGDVFLNEFSEQGQLDNRVIESIRLDSKVSINFINADVSSNLSGTCFAPPADSNEDPNFTNIDDGTVINVAENQTAVINTDAVDPDGDALTNSIVGGADADKFSIDPASGIITFKSPPDFENPGDADGNNVYELTVQVSDGKGGFDTDTILINVTDVDDGAANSAPEFTNANPGETISIPENTTVVRNLDAVDADGDNLTYSIVGGADSGRFQIDPTTGELSFTTPPDFEGENSAIGNDDIYDVTVRVEDGKGGSDEANLFINVTDVDETAPNSAPEFTNANPGETISIPENTTVVRNLDAFDVDGDNLTYSIIGGADAGRFQIDPSTGELSFTTPPDFEGENSAVGNDDIYDVTVQVSDGKGGVDTANLFVEVTDVDENGNPVITAASSTSVPEGSNGVVADVDATDPDGDVLTYAIVGGADAGDFTINSATGELSFASTPDFENPADANGDNVYEVEVQASDPTGATSPVAPITVTVTDLGENTAPDANDDPGNVTASDQPITLNVLANDTDPDGDPLTLSNPVILNTGPNGESLGSVAVVGNQLVYTPSEDAIGITADIQYTATDPGGLSDTGTAFVFVTDGNDAPVITDPGPISIDENSTGPVVDIEATDPDGDPITFALAGPDADDFDIDPDTGVITFTGTPDAENPTDTGGDNVYDVQVIATDGTLTDTQDVQITVDDVNEAPVLDPIGPQSTPEGSTDPVFTATASDPDGDTPTFSLEGPDAALFDIDPDTGEVTPVAPLDAETPTDDNNDGVYDVTVVATDPDGLRDEEPVQISVGDVNEDPILDPIGPQTTPENSTDPVFTATATDPEGDTPTFSLEGPDAALFDIDPDTGEVTPVAPLDAENPTDDNGDGVYDITVVAEDPNGGRDEEPVQITVGDVNEAPELDPIADPTIPEDSIDPVFTANATDPDGDTPVYSLEGPDAALFDIDPDTGEVTPVAPLDAENPTDDNGDGVYDVTVVATDPDGLRDEEPVQISVGDVNEDPILDPIGPQTTPENSTDPVFTATATDPEGDTPTFSLEGPDAALFDIDPDTGEVTPVAPLDAENPTDDNGDGVYDITVVAEDPNGGRDEEPVQITVGDVNEAPAANDDTDMTPQGTVVTLTPLANDSDPDGDTITISGATVPAAQGSVTFSDTEIVFTPAANFVGDATITYTISDGNGLSDTAEVSVTVVDVIGAVDGTDDGQNMVPGFTDAEGDAVDGADGPNDTIFGNGGDDTIDGGAGDDLVDGGADDDSLTGGAGDDTVDGGDGSDTLAGGEGDDELIGGAGDDDIAVGGGDVADGGSGDDVFTLDPTDPATDIDATIDGGTDGTDGNPEGPENGDEGDIFDLSDQTSDLTVDLTDNPETGTVDGLDGDGTPDIAFEEIEEILTGAGDDTIDGGDATDPVDVDTGGGDDSVTTGDGDDTVDAGPGSDVVDTGDGNDSVDGGDGNNLIDTSGDPVVDPLTGLTVDGIPDLGYPGLFSGDSDPNDDNDTVVTGSGDDTIITGDDADQITSGGGEDSIDAGIDADTIDAGAGDDFIVGGEGSDSILGGEGNDIIYAGNDPSVPETANIPDEDLGGFSPDLVPNNGTDFVDGGAGNDQIFGADDDDTLIGGTGNDTLDGGIDDDSLVGGAGNDEIIGGQGTDQMEGGDDRDVFLINGAGDGIGDTVVGGEGGDDVDTLDLTGSAPLGGSLNVIPDPTDPEAGKVIYRDAGGNLVGELSYSEIENIVPCFTPGTLIATPKGEVPVEALEVGDRVITRDNGVKTIEWIGQRGISAAQMQADKRMRPVMIKKGALGHNLPERDMMVSPNHRMLIADQNCQLDFGEPEVLVAAKHLIGREGIFAAQVPQTTYVHMMFAQHEVVLADGAWTESFQPGAQTLGGFEDEQREEIFRIFPELRSEEGQRAYGSARYSIKGYEAKLLQAKSS